MNFLAFHNYNQLTSLEHAPDFVVYGFSCGGNPGLVDPPCPPGADADRFYTQAPEDVDDEVYEDAEENGDQPDEAVVDEVGAEEVPGLMGVVTEEPQGPWVDLMRDLDPDPDGF